MITKEQVLAASGSELDEMVALAQGWKRRYSKEFEHDIYFSASAEMIMSAHKYRPTTNGEQCVEIMEREKIGVWYEHGLCWVASIDSNNGDLSIKAVGDTAMIAICRCFVLSKLEVINGQ